MSNNILILVASFCMVALRATQQLNVVHRFYWWAIGTSFLMAIAEITVIVTVVRTEWAAVPWLGTGGALGVTFAMYFHSKFISKK